MVDVKRIAERIADQQWLDTFEKRKLVRMIVDEFSALATPEAEPVAWGVFLPDGRFSHIVGDTEDDARENAATYFTDDFELRPLFTHASPPITEAEVEAALAAWFTDMPPIEEVEAVGGYQGVTLTDLKADMRRALTAFLKARRQG